MLLNFGSVFIAIAKICFNLSNTTFIMNFFSMMLLQRELLLNHTTSKDKARNVRGHKSDLKLSDIKLCISQILFDSLSCGSRNSAVKRFHINTDLLQLRLVNFRTCYFDSQHRRFCIFLLMPRLIN